MIRLALFLIVTMLVACAGESIKIYYEDGINKKEAESLAIKKLNSWSNYKPDDFVYYFLDDVEDYYDEWKFDVYIAPNVRKMRFYYVVNKKNGSVLRKFYQK